MNKYPKKKIRSIELLQLVALNFRLKEIGLKLCKIDFFGKVFLKS